MEDENAADYPSPVTMTLEVLPVGRTVAEGRKAIGLFR
jgi:hypothetical protein